MQKYIIHRSWRSYSIWKWTYQNWFWNNYVEEPKTKCGYWQRIIWVGLFALVLHAMLLPLRLLFYNFMYKQLVERHTTLGEISASMLIWTCMVTAAVWIGAEAFLTFMFGWVFIMLILLGTLVLLAYLLKLFFEETRPGRALQAAGEWAFTWIVLGSIVVITWPIWFPAKTLWQVGRRYYAIQPPTKGTWRKYREIEKVPTPAWRMHVYFWCSIAIWLGLGYCVGKFTPSVASDPSTGMRWAMGAILGLYLSIWVIAYLQYRKAKHEIWESELRSTATTSITGTVRPRTKIVSKNDATTLERCVAWLKERKLKVCPLTKVVD